MIFGQIKMLITILLITGIAGAGMYVMKLRADNATLKANQIKLETPEAKMNWKGEIIKNQNEPIQNKTKDNYLY